MLLTIKKTLPVLFFLLITVFDADAQNTIAIDSLSYLLSNAKEDTAKVNLLNKLAIEYRNSEPDKYIECLNKSNALAIKLNYKKAVANNFFLFGVLAQKQEKFEKALSLFNRSVEIAKEAEDTITIANCFNAIGTLHKNQGAYKTAIDYYLKSLALRERIKDVTGIGISYNNLGNVYIIKGDYDQAIKKYFQALDVFEKSNAIDKIPVLLMNIGNIYVFQKEYLKAIHYYEQALINNKDKNSMAMIYSNIGASYIEVKMYDKANENLSRSLKLAETNGNQGGIATALANMGVCNMKIGKYENALNYYFKALKMQEKLNNKKFISEAINSIAQVYMEKKDFEKSLEYGEKGLLLAKEIGAKESIKGSYENLSEIYKKLGNFEKAMEYYKLSVEIKDSIFSKEKMQSIAELNARYEADKKEKEIQLLMKDKQLKENEFKEQRMMRFSLIGGMMLLMILSFTLYNRYRFKQKANLLLNSKVEEIEFKNLQITDSISYAKTIQEAILPSDSTFQAFFPGSFILYKPKDIVSGDFYWVGEKNELLICGVADCTGHGVPGAFMSLLGNNILENVIKKTAPLVPASVLNVLNEEVLEALAKDKERASVKNGMDIGLITVDKQLHQLQYAGAHHSLYLVREGELLEIKGIKSRSVLPEKSPLNIPIM